jgi:hypothetical protein
MIALRIDDQTYAMWSERAAACGLTVEDWLKSETALRADVELQEARDRPSGAATIPEKDWTARLRTFAERHRPTGFPLDDGRESIYD